MTRSISSLVALALAGCFEPIAADKPDAGAAPDAAPPGKAITTRGSDGTYTTIVDSTSMTDWSYVDFETGAESATTGPWDLRFQRFHISTNGGSSGAGGVEVAPVPGLAFAQVTSPPASGWISDAGDGDDANMDPDYAFEQGDAWYDYDAMTHALTPKSLVWVMKTTSGSMIKLEIMKYYDDAGTAGWVTLHWGTM
jgi:hypothetical protein